MAEKLPLAVAPRTLPDRAGSRNFFTQMYLSARHRKNFGIAGLAILFVVSLCVPGVAHAQSVTLAWDASPDSSVRNYNVYVGSAPGAHDVTVESVPASQTTFAFTPSPGVLYYFAVSAVSTAGAEGPLSPEIVGSVPLLYPLSDRSSAENLRIVPMYLAALDPDGGTLRYSHIGLPVGLTLDQTSGAITGTPTAVGTYHVTIMVSDGLGTSSQSFDWTVRDATSGDTIAPTLSVTNPTSGQSVATTVTVSGTATDSAAGDSGITQVTVNGLLASGGTASANGTANWSRTVTLSSDSIIVEARDGAGNVSGQLIRVGRTASITTSVSITGLSSDLSSPQAAGTSITFTAAAMGGTGSYQFKWWLWDGSNWTMIRDWSSGTYTWTPTQARSDYRIGIWARDATSTADVGSSNLSIPYEISTTDSSSASAEASTLSLGLSSGVASPQAVGTSITFNATANGGSGSYQFKWWIWNGFTWTMVRDWGSAAYTWAPSQPSAYYRIGIWARDASSTWDSGQFNLSIPFPINPPGSLSLGLTSNLSLPQTTYSTLAFTASASGGSGSYQFKWWVYDGYTWSIARDWGSGTFTWTPTQANADYRIGIWARDATSTLDSGQFNLSIAVPITP